MITTMTKYEIISLKLKGWSNSRIQKEFSVSRSTIRKYWDDYQEKLSELLKEDPSLDVRYSFRQTVRKFRIQVAFQKRNDIPDEEYQIGNRRTEHSQ